MYPKPKAVVTDWTLNPTSSFKCKLVSTWCAVWSCRVTSEKCSCQWNSVHLFIFGPQKQVPWSYCCTWCVCCLSVCGAVSGCVTVCQHCLACSFLCIACTCTLLAHFCALPVLVQCQLISVHWLSVLVPCWLISVHCLYLYLAGSFLCIAFVLDVCVCMFYV